MATPTLAFEADLDAVASADDSLEPEELRERVLPEWYQARPAHVGQAIGELRAGLGLVGSAMSSTVAFWVLAALASTAVQWQCSRYFM